MQIVIIVLFDPELEHPDQPPAMGTLLSNVLAIIFEGSAASRVDRVVECRLLFGPSLSAGGERVAPHEGRNSNGSALAVMVLQDGVDVQISIVTYLWRTSWRSCCWRSLSGWRSLCLSTPSIVIRTSCSRSGQYTQRQNTCYKKK